ncbi:MAG: Rieske 2Fe-2S domain-containing protein, partial [Candidatus Eisenbacteria bacterium]|nr:Rieske 2Fe-2S domain-containing protein [Candidatus Eisenbacteria bacterium]
MSHSQSRRLVLERLGWLGIAVLGLLGIPGTIRFLIPHGMRSVGSAFDAGPLQDYLDTPVSTKWIKRHGVWIVRDHGVLFALRAVCSHLGCTPRWEADAQRFHCPCHGSLFSVEGTALRGPAREPLQRVAIWKQGGRILIDPADHVSQ